jgi:uridine kinase
VLRVSTLPDICLARRVLRDVKERGISPESNIVAWMQDVRPMWDKYNRFGLSNEHVLDHTHLIPGDDNAKIERLSMIDTILY